MRTIATLLLAALALIGVASCATSEATTDDTGGDTATIDTTGATVIDVRTPAEYAEGHLRGAVNIDVQNENGFLAGVRDLDRDRTYIVYCRSGNRSAAATARLRDLGFTVVIDAGGFDEAAEATGLEIVLD